MATRITQETDTGGGAANKSNTNYFNYTTSSSNKTTTNTKTTGTTTAKKPTTTKTTTPKTTTTKVPASTKKTYTRKNYSYSTPNYNTNNYNTSAGTATEEKVDNASKNWNQYLKLLNETYTNEANAIAQDATNYSNAANQNIAQSENQYNSAYNLNKSAIANLESQNKQREAIINQSINDYYNNMNATNKEKEAATLSAIENAYNALQNNASNFYQSVKDAYGRSMGYVNQGFNEGNEATARARDEAIELAAQIYAMGEETQNRQTEKDLKGQYISYMNGMKNINQRLASMGINGGAAESTLLGAINGYEANRTDLEEARASALGQLRQQQMQSDSEAQQAYLAKLADLISNRTTQQLSVENNRSTGEYNYANMKNTAESDRSNQLISANNNFQNWANALQSNTANMTQTAQNNFQQWASDLVNKKTTNESSYADAVRQLAEMKNTGAYNTATMQNQAAQSKSDDYGSTAYTSAIAALSEKNSKAKVKKTEKQKEKEKKQKEKEKKKKQKEKEKKKKEKSKKKK
jgi:hypothetical protein